MSIYISLLRGINVGGSKIMSMDAVCDIYSGLGFSYVRTYLQSGNVIFSSQQDDPTKLAGKIEARIEQMLGFRVAVFIRHGDEFQKIIHNNPFQEQAGQEPGKVHVAFLYRTPGEAAWRKLVLPENIPDQLARGDGVIYEYFPNGYAKAKINSGYLEKVLGVAITNRNWPTVNALYKMAGEI